MRKIASWALGSAMAIGGAVAAWTRGGGIPAEFPGGDNFPGYGQNCDCGQVKV